MALDQDIKEKDIKPLNIQDKDSLSSFVQDIHKFPMLEAAEEYQLATKWHQDNDKKSMDKLLKSHLRLVLKIAQGYRGYGLSTHDLLAEGNIGMMQAVRKFQPEKGFRFSTYAAWWIRSAIQEYILKNWSLVKIGTTMGQKKLFFNLRSLRTKLNNREQYLSSSAIQEISEKLNVSEKEVKEMEQRLQAQDYSLNAPIAEAGEGEWQDWLECPLDNQEITYLHRREMEQRKELLKKSLASLNQREHTILKYRRLHEPPKTLEELAQKLNLSKERIRQLEMGAFQKIQTEIRKLLTH